MWIRREVTILVALAGLSAPAVAQDTQLFRRLAEQLTRAAMFGDTAALDASMTPDFMFTVRFPEGLTIQTPRSTWLRRGRTVGSFRYEAFEVRLRGDSVVTTAQYEEKSSDWAPYTGRFAVTDVWVRDGDRWRIAARTQRVLVPGAVVRRVW